MKNSKRSVNKESLSNIFNNIEISDINQPVNEINSQYKDNSLESKTNLTRVRYKLPQEDAIGNPANSLIDNVHIVKFNIRNFLKYMILHLLYFFIFGPFIMLLSPLIGTILLKNMQLNPVYGSTNINQIIQYTFIMLSGILYFFTEVGPFKSIEIVMFSMSVFVRILTISNKYGYSSDAFINIMRTRIMTKEECANELILGPWLKNDEGIINYELQNAIMRLNIDGLIFYFDFISDCDEILKEKLRKEIKPSRDGQISRENNENDKELLQLKDEDSHESPEWEKRDSTIIEIAKLDRSFQNNNLFLVGATSNLQEKLNLWSLLDNKFLKKYFEKKPKYHDTKFNGYNIALDILRNAGIYTFKPILLVNMTLAIIRASIPSLYRLYQNESPFGNQISQNMLIQGTFSLNFIFYYANSLLLGKAILDMKKKVFYMKQITNLLSPIENYYEKKYYPIINIFDPMSLRTWGNLRKILFDYGARFYSRNLLNVSILTGLYFFVVVLLSLHFLGFPSPFYDELYLIVFIFESIVMLVVTFMILFSGAEINEHFKIHKKILKDSKVIISDILNNITFYFGDTAFESNISIYFDGINYLKKEFDLEDFRNNEASIVALRERLEMLIRIIDAEMEQIDIDKDIEPFHVLGFEMNKELIKTILAGIAAVGLAIIKNELGQN